MMRPNAKTDEVVPEELERKRKRIELNESTYYSTRGTKHMPEGGPTLKSNV